MRSLAFRLGALVFVCLFIAIAAGAGIIYGVHVTDRTVDRALDAQRRLDILTEMSGRIQQYGLLAIASVDGATAEDARLKEAELAVFNAIQSFEPEIAKAITASDIQIDQRAMAARARPLEQVRAGFRVLVRQINQALSQSDARQRGDSIRGAFNGFATLTGPYLFFLMQADRRGVEAGREQAREVSSRLTKAAIVAVAMAIAIAVALYRLVSRPILAAVNEIRAAAVAIGQGERNLRLPVRNRDELGLLAVVFNRMTARLRRGEERVAADQLALESTIAARTADLRAANDKLSEIDRSRRRFFADVSHELRTPLTVILGECEIALAVAANPCEPPASAFGVIRRRALRLQKRVEDMLRVARSESGTIELQFRPIPLRTLCASAIEAFEGATKRKDIAIVLVPHENDGAEPLIAGDFDWLRQIVEGLIDNALRYAKGASMIRLLIAHSDTTATLLVSDDGPGWGVDEPSSLLVRFARRGAGPVENVSGHGIGLSLVSWVVEKHGGKVDLATAPAPLGGAEIAIHLPLAVAA